jgi:hypothetical protein
MEERPTHGTAGIERPDLGDTVDTEPRTESTLPHAEARLLEQLRSGDAEAGRRFVGDRYPGLYQYLLYLTGQPDLTLLC